MLFAQRRNEFFRRLKSAFLGGAHRTLLSRFALGGSSGSDRHLAGVQLEPAVDLGDDLGGAELVKGLAQHTVDLLSLADLAVVIAHPALEGADGIPDIGCHDVAVASLAHGSDDPLSGPTHHLLVRRLLLAAVLAALLAAVRELLGAVRVVSKASVAHMHSRCTSILSSKVSTHPMDA